MPPPSADDSQQQQQPGGVAASPAPPTPPSEESSAGTGKFITAISNLRAIAKAFPETAPFIRDMLAIAPKVQQAMMKRVQPGEPQAPPT
jgi:hypothetical protein